jgi:hypothetical protein
METMVMGVVSRLVIYFVVFASGQYGQTAIRLASAVPSPAASVVEPLWMVGRARRSQPEQEAIRNGALDRSWIDETLKRGGGEIE